MVEVWLVQDRWSSGERLAYVRGGRYRARKYVAKGNHGVETASLMAWPLFKDPEIAVCGLCQVSGISFTELNAPLAGKGNSLGAT